MNQSKQGIGIIDSGIGGFTVAKAVAKMLPKEDIIYFGDGANAPYGNRSEEELVALAKYMVEFMNQKQVKMLLIACNTISCLAEQYEAEIQCPVLYVVKSGAKAAAQSPYQRIGVISTQFTHQQGMYSSYIRGLSPEKLVFSQGSTNLVRLIEENQGDEASKVAMKEECNRAIAPLLAENIDCCVLGCTHYPLAEIEFRECVPHLQFLDPAVEMAQEVKVFLDDNKLENLDGGILTVYTSGAVRLQDAHIKRAGLQVDSLLHHPPLVLG